jgi:N6-L-threonylcarbamoyladenine synthase
MILLGIDTSCDDTSAAVVEDGCRVLSCVVNSQIRVHHPYGGVVPELASREHVRNLVPVVEEALAAAAPVSSDPCLSACITPRDWLT